MNSRYIYVQKDAPGIYTEFNEALNFPAGSVGASWGDYVSGKWVLLSDEQVAFRETHPGASVREVFNMQLLPVPEPERTLEHAKAEKLSAIDAYDMNDVNRFFIETGGMKIPCWFDAQQRATYQTSINSRLDLIAAGLETDSTIRLPVAGQIVTLPLDGAKIMLARLQKYADDAFNVTYVHRSTVEGMTETEDVDGYDHTAGYPEQLTFTL